MSKRAEEAAYNYAKENGTLGYDYNQIYDAAKNGYEQAEKDTIERALEWLFSNVRDYLYCCVELDSAGITEEFFYDFQKAMEEE